MNSVSSSNITGSPKLPFKVVFAVYKSSFQYLYPEPLRLVAKSKTNVPLWPSELFAFSIKPRAVSTVYPVSLVTK